jgi:ribosomal protein L11 methyltransferase
MGKTIIINPGSGFGTGTHPTTVLCLRWIEKNIDHFDHVLDYGSGSGILSIASKLFGADSVQGVEIDKQAIKNSKNNNELNHVSIPYHQEEIFKPKKKYNLIISNILQPTLIKLSKKFEKLASNKILLSGVLEHQTDSLINSYDWIDLKIIDKLDDWTLLLGKLKS